MTEKAGQLKIFMGHILDIKAPYGSIAFNDIGATGVPNVAAEQTNKLFRAAHAFAEAYGRKTQQPGVIIDPLAAAVEAQLMVLVTLGVITSERADGLIDELRSLSPQQA